ncbi:MAG: calcium/sodium antiporter [Xanthomonadales bacterium]|nr:calcium/sodium antiporter [Xanthomonadales bacterium]
MDLSTVFCALLGLILLGIGGDVLVRGAVGLAELLKVSPLFTGLVLGGFGTSTPELVTSLSAALQGSPGIAIGNIIGSNIANTLLILGLTAIILPIPADPRSFRRDAPMLAIATLVCLAVVETSSVGRLSGALFLLLLAGYLWHTYRMEKQRHDAPALLHEQQGRLLEPAARSGALSAILALSGLAGILVGANLLVTASIQIAAALGIPDSIIGLTVVAVGTSLPELATSVAAAVKRQTDIALGNIIGSNIFNILGILGTTALVRPIRIPDNVVDFDAWVLFGVTGLLLYYALSEARISRSEGAVFLLLYAAYLVLLASRVLGAT